MHRRALAILLLGSGLAHAGAAIGVGLGGALGYGFGASTGSSVIGDGSDATWPERFLVRTEELCRPR